MKKVAKRAGLFPKVVAPMPSKEEGLRIKARSNPATLDRYAGQRADTRKSKKG